MRKANPYTRFAVCIDDGDYSASLQRGKVYPVLPDPSAEQRGYLRVLDDSGEDYARAGSSRSISPPR